MTGQKIYDVSPESYCITRETSSPWANVKQISVVLGKSLMIRTVMNTVASTGR